MKKSFAVVAFLLAILMGCQKDEQSKNSNQTNNPVPKISLHKVPAVMSGDDSIGIEHNNALASLIEFSRMNGGINSDECFIFLDQYYLPPSNADRAEIFNYAQKLITKQPIDSQEILVRLSVSNTAKQMLQSIIDIVRKQQVLDLNHLNERLAGQESKAMQTLKGEELSVVLQLCSISRNSGKFWQTYYGDHPTQGGEGFWKVLAAIHADNCGYLVGAICGDAGFWSAYFSATIGFSILGDGKVEI